MGKPTVLTTGECCREALAEHTTSIIFKSLGTLTFLYTASRVTSAFWFLVNSRKLILFNRNRVYTGTPSSLEAWTPEREQSLPIVPAHM